MPSRSPATDLIIFAIVTSYVPLQLLLLRPCSRVCMVARLQITKWLRPKMASLLSKSYTCFFSSGTSYAAAKSQFCLYDGSVSLTLTFVLHCFCYYVVVAQSCPTLCNPKDCSCQWDSLGKNIGVGCHALLQGIFLT